MISTIQIITKKIFIKNNKLLNNTDSIIEINEKKSVSPNQKYIENLESFINQNYPTERDQIIAEITKKG